MPGEPQGSDGASSQPSGEMNVALRPKGPTISQLSGFEIIPKELRDEIISEMPQNQLLHLASTSKALASLFLPELWIRDAKQANSAIFWAVRTRNLDAIKTAAGYGADVNKIRAQSILGQERSYTPLSSAIIAGDGSVVACLLEHGASPRVEVTEGWLNKGSAVMIALLNARRTRSCPAPLVSLMLPYVSHLAAIPHKDLTPDVPQDEDTATTMDLEVCICYLFSSHLQCSCSQGPKCSLSLIQSLIKHCRDCGSDHNRLLSLAVESVAPQAAVRCLLGPGVTPTTENIWDLLKTLTRLAKRRSNPRDAARYDELVQTFYDLANGLKEEPSDNFSVRRSLFTCVFSHRVDDGETKAEFLRYIINRGDDVNEFRSLRPEEHGRLKQWTPLLDALFSCFARHYGRLNNVARRPRQVLWVPVEIPALLEAGADPNKASPDGETALVSAVHCRLHGVVRLLLDHGADANKEGRSVFSGPRSCSPVLWAVYNTDKAMLELLLKCRDRHGDEDEAENSSLAKPLNEALKMPASKFNPGLVGLLVKHGAHITEESGHPHPLRWLLRAHTKPSLLKHFLRHGLDVWSAEEAGNLLDAFIRDPEVKYWREKLRLLIAAGAGRNQPGLGGDEASDNGEDPLSSSSTSSGHDDDEHKAPPSPVYFSGEE